MQQVNVLEAKNTLSRLISSAVEGDEVIIANRGKAEVKLVPVEAPAEKTGARAAQWLVLNPPPTPQPRSVAQLETDIAANREAWD